jgi:hypothetical protein
MLRVNVAGGTNAGRRIIRTVPTEPWPCNCLDHSGGFLIVKRNPPWLGRCPRCRVERPRS